MINTTTITIDLAKDVFQVAVYSKYFVTIRTLEQLNIATQHILRTGYIKQHTQLGNRIRGFALENAEKEFTVVEKPAEQDYKARRSLYSLPGGHGARSTLHRVGNKDDG